MCRCGISAPHSGVWSLVLRPLGGLSVATLRRPRPIKQPRRLNRSEALAGSAVSGYRDAPPLATQRNAATDEPPVSQLGAFVFSDHFAIRVKDDKHI